MKKAKIISSLLLVSAMFGVGTANAGFDLKKAAGLSGGDSGTTANAADVAKNTSAALGLMTSAEVDMLEALEGKAAVEAAKKQLENTKKGDPAGSKASLENLSKIDESVQPQLDEAMKKHATLDADQKKKMAVAGVEYVKGVNASRDLVGSIQNLAKNPTAMGADAGAILYAAKSVPTIVSKGANTTSSLTKLFSSNSMDTKELMGNSKSDK